MKTLLIILLMLPALPERDARPGLDRVRMMFFDMDRQNCGARQLFETIRADRYASPVMQAYAGATEAASAECVKGVFEKLEFFSRGRKNIERAVERQPQNAEIRFVRFATQANLPDFLNYDNIREDKALILDRLPGLIHTDNPDRFWRKVADYMASSGKLNKSETQTIRQLINKNN